MIDMDRAVAVITKVPHISDQSIVKCLENWSEATEPDAQAKQSARGRKGATQ